MSEPAILAVGTREQWRGVEVSDDGTPEILGVFLLRLLRRFGGLKGVAKRFVSSPWGWRNLPMREARDSGWAPWFTPDNPHSRTDFLSWFVLDVEGGRLEVYDVNEKQWLEPVRIAEDGRPLNRPDWVPEPSDWLPTRPAEVPSEAHRVLGCLRVADLSVDQARTVVLTWMKGLVPGADKGEWQLRCADDATCWSAWTLGGQRLWIPDRTEESIFDIILSTEECGFGLGSPEPRSWIAAAQASGLNRKKAGRFVEALFAAAVQSWAKHPINAGIQGTFHSEPSGPLDALKRKLFPPPPEVLPSPFFIEVLPALSNEELMRRIESGETPMHVVKDELGFHPGKDFEPPKGWLLNLVKALSVPVPAGTPGLPERRRMYLWPYDDA